MVCMRRSEQGEKIGGAGSLFLDPKAKSHDPHWKIASTLEKVPYVMRTMYVYTATRKNLVRISPHLCYTPKKIVCSSYYAVTCPCNTRDTYCMGGCPFICHMSVRDIVTQVCMSSAMMPIRVSQLQYIHRNTSVHLVC